MIKSTLFKKQSKVVTSQLSWESSHLFTHHSFDSSDFDFKFSVGLECPLMKIPIKVKMYQKENFLFYETDPQNRRPLIKVLSLDKPLADLKFLEQPVIGYRFQLRLRKGPHLVTLYINQVESWKKQMSKNLIWETFEKDFFVPLKSETGIFESEVKCKATDQKYRAFYFQLEDISQDRESFFENQISKIINLKHPNLAGIYRLYMTPTAFVVVEESISGVTSGVKNLSTFFNKKDTVVNNSSPMNSQLVITQLIRLQDYLEDSKILECGLCPNDVLVTKENDVLLSNRNLLHTVSRSSSVQMASNSNSRPSSPASGPPKGCHCLKKGIDCGREALSSLIKTRNANRLRKREIEGVGDLVFETRTAHLNIRRQIHLSNESKNSKIVIKNQKEDKFISQETQFQEEQHTHINNLQCSYSDYCSPKTTTTRTNKVKTFHVKTMRSVNMSRIRSGCKK